MDKRETRCTSCIHRNVCESYKKEYLFFVEQATKIVVPKHVTLKILCDFYKQEFPLPRNLKNIEVFGGENDDNKNL